MSVAEPRVIVNSIKILSFCTTVLLWRKATKGHTYIPAHRNSSGQAHGLYPTKQYGSSSSRLCLVIGRCLIRISAELLPSVYLMRLEKCWDSNSKLFKFQWLLYVPPETTSKNSTFCPHTVFMCFVWISEQTAIISLYSIN